MKLTKTNLSILQSTTLFIVVFLCGRDSFSQNVSSKTALQDLFSTSTFQPTDSGIYEMQAFKGNCKAVFQHFVFVPTKPIEAEVVAIKQPATVPVESVPFLSIHGNVAYHFNYRSYIDTPFAEKDVMQHSVQTRLNVKLKDRYPFTVFLTSRRSNSSFFSNATDVSFQFRQTEMLEDIKAKMRKETDELLSNKSFQLTPAQIYQRQKDGLPGDLKIGSLGDVRNKAGEYANSKRAATEEKFKKLYGDYKSKMDQLNEIQNWTKHSSRDQELVEEKEKKLRGRAGEIRDSVENVAKGFALAKTGKYAGGADSSIKGAKDIYAQKKHQADSLKKEIAAAEQALKSFQKKVVDSVQQIKRQIAAITDRNGLYDYLQKQGKSAKELPALQRALLSVKQIGIGRSWIDYSELTVKNISLSGVNIEVNPGNIYLAAAAGKVNYRFRDYIIKGNTAGSGQSVGLIRAGFGRKERNNVILTYYAGKKALLNQRSTADSSAVQNIAGISVESRYIIDKNNFLTAEYARSVSPNINGKILDLKTHTNEAWSLKLFSEYPNTKVNSYYRRTGEGFQSFTLYPSNNKQDAWMVRVRQMIWKKKLMIDGAVRKNDFESPIAAPDFRNKNVFKSIQVTARVPKYPFVSAGYYPSSQLTLSNNNVLYENRYNTLNGIISHSYTAGGLSMNSNATYTKFYNEGSDTGFVYFNASTFTLNHSVTLKSFILQGIMTLTDQSLLRQTTLEPVLTYQLKNKLSVSGSVKWTRLNRDETLWGGTAGVNLYLKKIGVIQMQYDKIFLPGYNRNLLPVDMGRLTYSREF